MYFSLLTLFLLSVSRTLNCNYTSVHYLVKPHHISQLICVVRLDTVQLGLTKIQGNWIVSRFLYRYRFRIIKIKLVLQPTDYLYLCIKYYISLQPHYWLSPVFFVGYEVVFGVFWFRFGIKRARNFSQNPPFICVQKIESESKIFKFSVFCFVWRNVF